MLDLRSMYEYKCLFLLIKYQLTNTYILIVGVILMNGIFVTNYINAYYDEKYTKKRMK